MKSGKMDRKATVERLTTTRSATGAVIETWATQYEGVSIERETQGATERFIASQTVADVDTLFRTRWNPWGTVLDVKLHRLVYRERTYNILALQEIGRREGLHIACKSRADTGGVT